MDNRPCVGEPATYCCRLSHSAQSGSCLNEKRKQVRVGWSQDPWQNPRCGPRPLLGERGEGLDRMVIGIHSDLLWMSIYSAGLLDFVGLRSTVRGGVAVAVWRGMRAEDRKKGRLERSFTMSIP